MSVMNNNGNYTQQQEDECKKIGDHQAFLNPLPFMDPSRIYVCVSCDIPLTSRDEIISKTFHGNSGRAYLVHSMLNYTTGPLVERTLMTGQHVIATLYCASCKAELGWKYEKAYEISEKYKEQKFAVEMATLKNL